jgi:hypothetical protein
MQRLSANIHKTHWIGSNYNFTADVPTDPRTKLPITTEAATTLKYLDATQQVKIEDLTVQYGGVKVPQVIATPLPTSPPIPTPKSTELSPP